MTIANDHFFLLLIPSISLSAYMFLNKDHDQMAFRFLGFSFLLWGALSAWLYVSQNIFANHFYLLVFFWPIDFFVTLCGVGWIVNRRPLRIGQPARLVCRGYFILHIIAILGLILWSIITPYLIQDWISVLLNPVGLLMFFLGTRYGFKYKSDS